MMPTAVAFGQGNADIVAAMAEEGIFLTITEILMFPDTGKDAARAIGELAGTSDQAAWHAKVCEKSTAASENIGKQWQIWWCQQY